VTILTGKRLLDFSPESRSEGIERQVSDLGASSRRSHARAKFQSRITVRVTSGSARNTPGATLDILKCKMPWRCPGCRTENPTPFDGSETGRKRVKATVALTVAFIDEAVGKTSST